MKIQTSRDNLETTQLRNWCGFVQKTLAALPWQEKKKDAHSLGALSEICNEGLFRGSRAMGVARIFDWRGGKLHAMTSSKFFERGTFVRQRYLEFKTKSRGSGLKKLKSENVKTGRRVWITSLTQTYHRRASEDEAIRSWAIFWKQVISNAFGSHSGRV